MIRVLAPILAAALLALGGWSYAAARGYEHGKIDAQNALAAFGVVVLHADGSCFVYDHAIERVAFSGPARAHMTLLIRPTQ